LLVNVFGVISLQEAPAIVQYHTAPLSTDPGI